MISLFFFLAPQTSEASTLASKLSLKTGFQMLKNLGSSGGAASGGAGFDLSGTAFLTPRLSIGLGYSSSFNFSQSSMPINGYYLQGRYYYLRDGTRVQDRSTWGEMVSHPDMTPYVGMSYQKTNYYLGKDPLGTKAADSLAGTYASGLLSLGLDYRIDSQFEWNLEGAYSLFTFAASDERVRIQSMGVYMGLNFLF